MSKAADTVRNLDLLFFKIRKKVLIKLNGSFRKKKLTLINRFRLFKYGELIKTR